MRSIEFPIPYRLQGWTISVFLHGIFVSLAILALADVKFVRDQNVFRWEVAVVESPAQKPTPPATSQSPAPPLSQPMPTKTASRSNTPKPTMTRHGGTKQVVESVQPTPTPLSAQPLERQVVERRPVEDAQPLKHNEVPQQVSVTPHPVEAPQTHEQKAVAQEKREQETREIEKAAPVEAQTLQGVAMQQKQDTLQETTPVTKETSARVVAAAESPQPVTKPGTRVEETAPTNGERSVPPSATPLESPGAVTREAAAIVKESLPVESRLPVIARTIESTREQLPVDGTHSPQAHQDALLSAHPPSPERAETRSFPGDAPLAKQAPLTGMMARAFPAPHADFGWLMQALWRRIEQLKRYPTRARMNRWEGTVVVRAVIKDDGYFAELVMEKSSGHEDLDKDALELLERASPLKLKHDLRRPAVTIRIPISYKLE